MAILPPLRMLAGRGLTIGRGDVWADVSDRTALFCGEVGIALRGSATAGMRPGVEMGRCSLRRSHASSSWGCLSSAVVQLIVDVRSELAHEFSTEK